MSSYRTETYKLWQENFTLHALLFFILHGDSCAPFLIQSFAELELHCYNIDIVNKLVYKYMCPTHHQTSDFIVFKGSQMSFDEMCPNSNAAVDLHYKLLLSCKEIQDLVWIVTIL